jgi:hypothetical protein
VSEVTGMSRNTIRRDVAEVEGRKKNPQAVVEARLRRTGGGRTCLPESDPGVLKALDALVEPVSRGDPQSALRWTGKSTTRLAEELTRQAHPIGVWTVGALLRVAGDSVQRNRTTKEGATHPDRNAQFEHINMMVTRLQPRGQPGIAVDTKKKELVGPFKNGGREWPPKGEPEEVDRHDFPDLQLGKVISSGVVDLSQNEGWVSVRIAVARGVSEARLPGTRSASRCRFSQRIG